MAPGTVDVHHHFFSTLFHRDVARQSARRRAHSRHPRLDSGRQPRPEWTAIMWRRRCCPTSSRIEAFGLPPDRLRDIVRRFND